MLCLQYFHNKFYVIDCYLLLLVRKNNFSCRFKLITCNNLTTKICCENIVKML